MTIAVVVSSFITVLGDINRVYLTLTHSYIPIISLLR